MSMKSGTREPLMVNATFALIVMIILIGLTNAVVALYWGGRTKDLADEFKVAQAGSMALAQGNGFDMELSDEQAMGLAVKLINGHIDYAIHAEQWDKREQMVCVAADYLNAYMASKVATNQYDNKTMRDAMTEYGVWEIDPDWAHTPTPKEPEQEKESKKLDTKKKS